MGRIEDLKAKDRLTPGGLQGREANELSDRLAERDRMVRAPGEVPIRPDMPVRAPITTPTMPLGPPKATEKKSFAQKVKGVFIREDEKLKERNQIRRAKNAEKELKKQEIKKVFDKAKFKAAKKAAKKLGRQKGKDTALKATSGFLSKLGGFSKGLNSFTSASMNEAAAISSKQKSGDDLDFLGFGAPRSVRKQRGRKKQRNFDLNDIL